MRAKLAALLGLGCLLAVQACAPVDDEGDEELSDDPVAVADAELRAGGIDKIVVKLPEDDLSGIVARVERLEKKGHSSAAVETYAVARALEAWRRAPQAPESPLSEGASVGGGGLQPLGSYLWDHVKLNDLESALCRSKKVACLKTLYVAHRAKSKSRELYADGENGGRRDAFRHSYWNARMVWAAGEAWAKDFADAHENGYPDNRATVRARLLSDMDFFNNEVGRVHGGRFDDDGALIDALSGAISRGELRAVRFGAGDTGALVGTDTCTADTPCGT